MPQVGDTIHARPPSAIIHFSVLGLRRLEEAGPDGLIQAPALYSGCSRFPTQTKRRRDGSRPEVLNPDFKS